MNSVGARSILDGWNTPYLFWYALFNVVVLSNIDLAMYENEKKVIVFSDKKIIPQIFCYYLTTIDTVL